MPHVTETKYYISEFLTVTCFFVTLFYLARYVKKARKLPPGPMGLPLVGYLPFLTKMPHLEMAKLAAKYGDLFSMRLGSSLFVVLNKGSVIREAFSKPEFLGRPPDTLFNFLIKGFESPFFSNGKKWQEQRRFAMHAMRDLGFGKSWMEKHIVEEIEHFLDGIRKKDGMPITITEHLTPSMSNNICSLVFGRRYKYDDPQRKFLDQTLEIVARSLNQLTYYVFFPWLRKLPFISNYLQTEAVAKQGDDLMNFVRERIKEHEKTLDLGNTRDYIDGYLVEMKRRLEEDPQTVFSRNMLAGSVINLFGAGSETVRTTLDWCLYAVAEFQDVQKKVQSEIEEIIGNERMPSWLDHKQMPFTEAVLAEIMRWKTVTPLSLVRYTLGDTEMHGYHIPKGTSVIPNLWSVHNDPKEWEHPHEFKPDRFLSKDGKSYIRPENYIPFSTGKRSCPGEILAVIEVFLYFTSVLQRFEVELPKGTVADFEGKLGITYHPKPHKLCFKRRP